MNRTTTVAANCSDSEQGLLLTAACKATLGCEALLASLYNRPQMIRIKVKTNFVTEPSPAAQVVTNSSLHNKLLYLLT